MRMPAGGWQAEGREGCKGGRPSARRRERGRVRGTPVNRRTDGAAEVVRVPLLIILIAHSKVARGVDLGGDSGVRRWGGREGGQ